MHTAHTQGSKEEEKKQFCSSSSSKAWSSKVFLPFRLVDTQCDFCRTAELVAARKRRRRTSSSFFFFFFSLSRLTPLFPVCWTPKPLSFSLVSVSSLLLYNIRVLSGYKRRRNLFSYLLLLLLLVFVYSKAIALVRHRQGGRARTRCKPKVCNSCDVLQDPPPAGRILLLLPLFFFTQLAQGLVDQ